MREGAPAAFCFVAPRPACGSWRLATMGAVPAARGTGAAPALLDDFIDRARQTGCRQVELECFAQNTRALRLYEGRGFRVVDALHGYELAAPGGDAAAAPPAVDLDDAFGWLEQCGIDLPLQVTPASLRALPGLLAFREGQAQVIVSLLGDQRLHVHSLLDREPGQQDAERLLRAVRRAHPRRSLHVPQLQRPGVGGEALERLGAKRLPLHQVWMRRGL
nr:GNAT family N-acetyltransferase [Ramlibacter algicola]